MNEELAKELKNLLELYGNSLNTWETEFLSDQLTFFATGNYNYTQEREKYISSTHQKLLSAKATSLSRMRGKCGDCGDDKWILSTEFSHGPLVRRCHCMGGPARLAEILRSKGDFQLADKVIAQEQDPEFIKMFENGGA